MNGMASKMFLCKYLNDFETSNARQTVGQQPVAIEALLKVGCYMYIIALRILVPWKHTKQNKKQANNIIETTPSPGWIN